MNHDPYAAALARLQELIPFSPGVAMVLGSGLGSLADTAEEAVTIPYSELPGWPVGTVPGHAGRLVAGRLENRPVVLLQGRSHYYEGLSAREITFPVRVLKQLGVQILILTNAAGGMNDQFRPGDLMLIRDHLNLVGLAGHNPLRGPNDERFGPRFPDMTTPYDLDLRQLAHDVAAAEGFTLQEGVYAYVAGPSFETPAELRFLRAIGGDAVGMSTVPSVIVARHAGIRVLGISTITNLALPDPPPGHETSHDEVLETGLAVVPRLSALLRGLLRRLP